ncbi:MAG: TetR/AcrR family transcriptional regulator C-terminal domain-containing protein [Eggerthellaceae bacterium]|nr:TetR/AcrR family transcriptional regulator C-terminal domain-containing protein [Eggerthellaceae bacterium]
MAAQTREGKKLDRRVVRTRKAIMDAFDHLVMSEDVDKITVSAIAREADIDRKTFYLHYNSIDDLVNYKTEASLEYVLSALKERGQNASFDERIHIALQEANVVINREVDVYSRIVSRLSIDQILAYFERAAEPAMEHSGYKLEFIDDPEKRMRLQFYIAGALSLYATWLKTGRKEPIEKISAVIEESIR